MFMNLYPNFMFNMEIKLKRNNNQLITETNVNAYAPPYWTKEDKRARRK